MQYDLFYVTKIQINTCLFKIDKVATGYFSLARLARYFRSRIGSISSGSLSSDLNNDLDLIKTIINSLTFENLDSIPYSSLTGNQFEDLTDFLSTYKPNKDEVLRAWREARRAATFDFLQGTLAVVKLRMSSQKIKVINCLDMIYNEFTSLTHKVVSWTLLMTQGVSWAGIPDQRCSNSMTYRSIYDLYFITIFGAGKQLKETKLQSSEYSITPAYISPASTASEYGKTISDKLQKLVRKHFISKTSNARVKETKGGKFKSISTKLKRRYNTTCLLYTSPSPRDS